MGKLFDELKRRKVFRVAAVYAVVARLVIQVAADGRFLINALVDEGATAPITLIQNWNPEAAQ